MSSWLDYVFFRSVVKYQHLWVFSLEHLIVPEKKFLNFLCWCWMWSRNLLTRNLETEGLSVCWRAGPPCFQSDFSPLPVWSACSLADSISLDLKFSNKLPPGLGKAWSFGIMSLPVYVYLIASVMEPFWGSLPDAACFLLENMQVSAPTDQIQHV